MPDPPSFPVAEPPWPPDPPWPSLHEAVLGWYAVHGRVLAFRVTRDPYAILVSEAMAQQTQAARAGEAWTRFMDRFPTVAVLASATPADVLRAWHGLGYNRRALNLWRAARLIVDLNAGQVPSDLDALQALPGVGAYTARAVAAIGFGQPVGAVDTNVRRVIGRIVAGDGTGLGSSALQRVADAAVPGDRPGAWTHAVMDLGATICLPRRPDCGACPAARWCRYADQVRGAVPGATLPAGGDTLPIRPRRAARATAPLFQTTSRWLRGRIVSRLRLARDDEWVVIGGPIGTHDHAAVLVALDALAHEGLIEVDRGDGTGQERLARLPVG